ncbi:Eisosome component PIL1-domain-containing protein [Chlamydoabsidia padenii]|nr:Eisosome component PIL1-domain-containing protein [Chlamydoabsidia padenii]
MNFKDLQYSIGKLTTDVRSQLARNNPLQKQDTKALSMWIFNERNNLAMMRTLAYQQAETIKVFQQWTKEELSNDKEENGRDIEDIGDKLVKLLEKQTEVEQQYAAKYQQYRHAIKSIRDREDRLSDIHEKKRTLSSRINNLTKSSPKSPKLRELQKELASLDRDTHDTELEMGDFKRFALKEAFYLRFNAMNEYAEKTAIVAGFGKYIVDLLDIAPTPATSPTRRTYDKGKDAAIIFADAMNAVDGWRPHEGDERPTIATNNNKQQDIKLTDIYHSANEKDDNSDDDAGNSDNVEKGKRPMEEDNQQQQVNENEHDDTTTSNTTDIPPRSSFPTIPATPAGYSVDAIASVTGDHKSSQHQETIQDLDQLDLYDIPPPAYQPSNQQEGSSSPLNSDESMPIPFAMPSLSPPAPPTTSHAQPIAHEDKEEMNNQSLATPYSSSHPNHYQQSPQPMHQYQPSPPQAHQMYYYHHQHSPLPHHSSSMLSTASFDSTSTMGWNVSYGGIEPQYHHGQYQQLYDQMTQRQQQHGPRPYSEFQQQYRHPSQQQQYQYPGGFRVPDQQSTIPTTYGYSAADEEKRQLAERYALEETRARQASIQTLYQEQKPLPASPSPSSSTQHH